MFNETTIFFCDIVGFTNIASDSTANQIIDFLNDLYSLFDERLDNYDVYKVLTSLITCLLCERWRRSATPTWWLQGFQCPTATCTPWKSPWCPSTYSPRYSPLRYRWPSSLLLFVPATDIGQIGGSNFKAKNIWCSTLTDALCSTSLAPDWSCEWECIQVALSAASLGPRSPTTVSSGAVFIHFVIAMSSSTYNRVVVLQKQLFSLFTALSCSCEGSA